MTARKRPRWKPTMTTLAIVAVELPIKVYEDKDCGVWVSWVPVLNIYSQGETQREAIEAGRDAATLFLRHHPDTRRT